MKGKRWFLKGVFHAQQDTSLTKYTFFQKEYDSLFKPPGSGKVEGLFSWLSNAEVRNADYPCLTQASTHIQCIFIHFQWHMQLAFVTARLSSIHYLLLQNEFIWCLPVFTGFFGTGLVGHHWWGKSVRGSNYDVNGETRHSLSYSLQGVVGGKCICWPSSV